MKESLKKFYLNKKVLITGHTGFKGAWLTAVLLRNKAKIIGISKDIPTNPSLYKILKLEKKIKDHRFDLSSYEKFKKVLISEKPDIIFHLAAQAIVSKSYKDPKKTWNSNLISSLNLLEILRKLKKNCIVVLITSDKCYFNVEKKTGYKESERLGGNDHYSASKACTEILFNSYFKSNLHKNSKLRIATARAGNVIGGGDWANDRLIPDCVSKWSKNKVIKIRNPNSTRPWQHVLEAIYGYLFLAIKLKNNKKINGLSFNFGPSETRSKPVKNILNEFKKYWKKIKWKYEKTFSFTETNSLRLNSELSKKLLNWECKLTFSEMISLVSNWYLVYYKKKNNDLFQFTSDQIEKFEKKFFNK
tara:strand:+ start:1768 stop:2847 length:1080 start_codon:yes stop_codon:yes gene_type:complete